MATRTKNASNNQVPAGTELTAMSPVQPDPYLVAFDDQDSENPKNWPERRKWTVTNVLSVTGFNRILVSTVMAPALSLIAVDLEMNSTEAMMALSIYLLATAFGPLVIGPLSEVYGRQVILHASNIWFLVWNIACGFASSKELLIAARFLAGFGASAIYALGGGVLGDIWRPEERGRSLGWFLLVPLLGAAVGKCPELRVRQAISNSTHRPNRWWLHDISRLLEMDVLVNIHLSICHGCRLTDQLPRDVCPSNS